MKPNLKHDTWLDLSQAAEYLGVHYTTLRRWADAGEIACIRTPGGRRRFSERALAQFIQSLGQGFPAGEVVEGSPGNDAPLKALAIDKTRASLRDLPAPGDWMGRLTPEQRLSMRGTGDRLVALLLQYNSRADGGEAFLEEGRRIMRDYSQVCSQIGMTLPETARVFLFFRRSVLEAIYQAGNLPGAENGEGQRIYLRANDFLDVLMVSLMDDYLNLTGAKTETQ